MRSIVVTFFLFVVLFSPWASAAPSQPQDLLQSMAQASRSLNYQGRFLYQLGADVSTMEIRHAVIDGREYQRLTHLDGELVEVVRRGDEVLCLHPDRTVTRLRRTSADPLTLRERLASDIPDQYNVLIDGDGRVAGRQATLMRVAPLDTHRYGYRLWLDRDSQLLLKSETVDGAGVALERVEFVSLSLTPELSVADFSAPKGVKERSLALVADAGTQTVKVDAGWLPSGFESVERDWRHSGKGADPVAARGFSDGLAAFTVFVEEVGDTSVEEGVSRVGPTVAVSRQVAAPSGNYLITLVGEVPQATAERVAAGISIHDNP